MISFCVFPLNLNRVALNTNCLISTSLKQNTLNGPKSGKQIFVEDCLRPEVLQFTSCFSAEDLHASIHHTGRYTARSGFVRDAKSSFRTASAPQLI